MPRSTASSVTKEKVFSSSGRLKSHTSKLKYQTTKIMSGSIDLKHSSRHSRHKLMVPMFPGLKAAQSAMVVNPVKRYSEHKDGVWEVGGGCQDVRMMVTVSPVPRCVSAAWGCRC